MHPAGRHASEHLVVERPNQKTQSREREGVPTPSARTCLYDNHHRSAQHRVRRCQCPRHSRAGTGSRVWMPGSADAEAGRRVGSDFQTRHTDQASVLRAGHRAPRPGALRAEQAWPGPASQKGAIQQEDQVSGLLKGLDGIFVF